MTGLLHAALFAAALLPGGEGPAVRVLRTGGLKMESVALLVSGEQGGSIHVAVLPLLLPGAAGRARVPVVLEIDGATLLKGNTGGLLRVEICLYAVAKKAVQGSLLETIEADLTGPSAIGPEVERSGLQYTGELSLAPGDYSLRVLVRNALTGEVGLRLLNLTVPDFGIGPLLLSPVFANPASSWVAALSKAAQTSPAALADSRLPAAQAVLGIDQEARVEIPAWHLKPEGLKIEVLRPDGGRAAELPARIEARREAAGIEWLTVSFVPSGLETGRYQIRAMSPEAAPAWSSPFVLLPGGGEGKVWAELMHGVPSPAQEAREPARSRRRRLDAGPIRDAYRESLRLLAAGDEPAARRAVSALETPLLTGQVPASPEDVTEIELDVAKDLAAARPQSLLPVTLLHAALYSATMQRHDLLVATHHRELVFALADLYAERAGAAKADARRTAARLLLGFASRLPESVSPLLRERLFEQVLAYNPDEPATVLYLAAEAERGGRYPEAVTHLQRLLLIRPNDPEARLRLAVNLRRLGKPAEADRLLDGLIRAPKAAETPETTDAWVLTLAYQETARALLAAGRLDDAQTFLRDALQRLPGDEKLLLQRASLYDMRSDPARAREILAGFHAVREGAESARHRYNRRPTDALNQAWNELVRAAPEQLPALAEALKPASSRRGS